MPLSRETPFEGWWSMLLFACPSHFVCFFQDVRPFLLSFRSSTVCPRKSVRSVTVRLLMQRDPLLIRGWASVNFGRSSPDIAYVCEKAIVCVRIRDYEDRCGTSLQHVHDVDIDRNVQIVYLNISEIIYPRTIWQLYVNEVRSINLADITHRRSRYSILVSTYIYSVLFYW